MMPYQQSVFFGFILCYGKRVTGTAYQNVTYPKKGV